MRYLITLCTRIDVRIRLDLNTLLNRLQNGLFLLLLILNISCSSSEPKESPNASFEVALDSDLVPATITLENNSQNATSFMWSFPGGIPSESFERDPGPVVYTEAGDYTISLEASREGIVESSTIDFTLYTTDEILTFKNIILGNENMESILGVSFSTRLGRVIKPQEYTQAIGPDIDVLYYGSKSHVLYSMVTPSFAGTEGFGLIPIPNARETILIYETDEDSEFYFTPAEFDQMENDRLFRHLKFFKTRGSLTDYTGATELPRVFLFKNADSKIGLIKVNKLETESTGQIEFDIKIQK